VDDDLTFVIYQFRNSRLAVVTRPICHDRAVVCTQQITDPGERPDWLRLIADVRGPLINVPEAS